MAEHCKHTALSALNSDKADTELIRATALDILFNTDLKDVIIVTPMRGILEDLVAARMGRLMISCTDEFIAWTESNGTYRQVRTFLPGNTLVSQLGADCAILHFPNVSSIPASMRRELVEPMIEAGCQDIRLLMSAAMYATWVVEDDADAAQLAAAAAEMMARMCQEAPSVQEESHESYVTNAAIELTAEAEEVLCSEETQQMLFTEE